MLCLSALIYVFRRPHKSQVVSTANNSSKMAEPVVTINKNDSTSNISTSQDLEIVSTSLHEAFHAGNYQLCDIELATLALLSRTKPLANPTDATGLSHLHITCARNYPHLLLKLLDAGIGDPDVPARSDSGTYYAGWSAAHFAAAFGAASTFEELAHRGAELFSRDARDKLPLHYLILSSVPRGKGAADRALNLLLTRLEMRDDEMVRESGLTNLHAACLADRPDLVERLFSYGEEIKLERPARVDCPRWPGYRPIHAAARHAGPRVIRLLLDRGAKLEATEAHGLTPLQLACARGSFEIASLLLERGADPGARGPTRLTCLALAFKSGNPKLVRLLLSKGPGANPSDNEGLTGFHRCCLRSWLVEVQALLDAGLPIDTRVHPFARKYAGYTGAHLAAVCGQPRLLEMLIENGASLGLSDSRGRTALKLAETKIASLKKTRRTYRETIELLKRHNAPIRSEAGLSKNEDENVHVMAVAFGHKEPVLIEVDLIGSEEKIYCARELKLMPVQLRLVSSRQVILRILFRYGADAVVLIRNKVDETKTDGYKLKFKTYLEDPRARMVSQTGLENEVQRCYYVANSPALEALARYGLQLERRSWTLSNNFHVCGLDFFLAFVRQLKLRTLLGFGTDLPKLTEQCPDFFEKLDAVRRAEFDELPTRITRELNKLNERLCPATGLTFRELFRNRHALAMHLARGGDEYKDMLKDKNFDDEFPTLGGLLRLKFREAMGRRDLLIAAIPKIGWLVREGLRRPWPDLAADYVVAVLSDEDLKRMINA